MKNKDMKNKDIKKLSSRFLKNKHILSVEMPRKDLLILQKFAKGQDRSVSSIIRSMVKQFLLEKVS